MDKSSMNTQIKNHLRQHFALPEEQIELMLPEFKKTLSQHMSGLLSAYRQENLIDLKNAAHTIKGALLNLGFSESAQLAQTIEMESAAGNNMINYSSLIDTIKSNINEFIGEQ
jgi:HPt (histidine-containing phosphotransfer) domain-containing protein